MHSAQAQQTPPQRSRTTPRTQHLIPPPLPPLTRRILLCQPDPHATHPLQHRWQRVLVALADRHDALVEKPALVRVEGHGGDEEWPGGVDGCVEGALDGEGEEEGGEGVGEGGGGGVEAGCAVGWLVDGYLRLGRGYAPVETAAQVDERCQAEGLGCREEDFSLRALRFWGPLF